MFCHYMKKNKTNDILIFLKHSNRQLPDVKLEPMTNRIFILYRFHNTLFYQFCIFLISYSYYEVNIYFQLIKNINIKKCSFGRAKFVDVLNFQCQNEI